jgi:competence protein ComEC
LLAPLAFAFGAAGYLSLPVEPPWWTVLAPVGAFLALAFVLRRWGDGWMAFAFLLLAFASGGAVAGKVRVALLDAPVVPQETRPVSIEGVIAEIDAGARNRRLRIEVSAIEGLSPAETPRYVRFSVRGDIAFSPGRAVRCRAMLSPPARPVVPGDYAFQRDAWFQQLGAVGFSVGDCVPLSRPVSDRLSDRIRLYLGALRRAISEHVNESGGGGGGGVAAAMIAGDRSFIDVDDAEALRVSGLSHLISISGVHMVLAGGAFFIAIRLLWPLLEPLALRVPAPRVAAAGAIVAVTLYFLISGGEVATQRAYIMALIGFGAKLFDRPAISLRSLAVAMVVVVALQPESVLTPGFQMSFAASAALVALFEIWPRLEGEGPRGVFERMRGWAVGAVSTSLAASAATFPFALHHFERAAMWSVLANVVASPVISLGTTPAAVAAAVASSIGLEEAFFWLMARSLDVVLWIAHTASAASPEVSLPVLGPVAMAASATAIALFVVFTGFGRLLALLPAALALGLWLNSPRVVGYVASDGAVYVRTAGDWVLIDAWRGESGLRPMAIRDRPAKAPCPDADSDPRCALEIVGGRLELVRPAPPVEPKSHEDDRRGDDPEPKPVCIDGGIARFLPATAATPLEFAPCDLARRGGAVIESGPNGRRLRLAPAVADRPWTR